MDFALLLMAVKCTRHWSTPHMKYDYDYYVTVKTLEKL
jgi:hypothetical protein